jgi:transposase
MALRLRAMTDDESRTIDRLAHARTAAARAVERARIIMAAGHGQRAPAIAEQLGISAVTVRHWITRFHADGVDGLVDAPRSGHPPTYTAEQVGAIIAAALTKPTDRGLPFASWTLDRLEAYLNEEKGIPIKRSRIDDLLLAEGLRWRTQEGWCGERVGRDPTTDRGVAETPIDAEFAPKRGRLSRSTRRRRPAA